MKLAEIVSRTTLCSREAKSPAVVRSLRVIAVVKLGLDQCIHSPFTEISTSYRKNPKMVRVSATVDPPAIYRPDYCKYQSINQYFALLSHKCPLFYNGRPRLSQLVSWCLTSLFSTNIWLYLGRKVRGGELSLPSIGRPAIY